MVYCDIGKDSSAEIILLDYPGFEQQWIQGKAAFYRDASSHVLMTGSIGKSFKMSQPVHQGCPPAPYLFIIVAEALHYQIAYRFWQIQGLPLPDDEEMLIGTEYEDDTTTYVKGDANNLDILQSEIDEFYRDSGAQINWNKLVGIWISNKSMLNWALDLNFRWLEERRSYLIPRFQNRYGH